MMLYLISFGLLRLVLFVCVINNNLKIKCLQFNHEALACILVGELFKWNFREKIIHGNSCFQDGSKPGLCAQTCQGHQIGTQAIGSGWWTPSTVNRHLQWRGAFIPLPIISILGKRETERGKDSSEEVDRAKAQGTESPSVSCPPHSTAVHR